MSKEIEAAVEAAIYDKLPETPGELARRLKLWIEAAESNDAAKYIIQADGAMADELFALLQQMYVFLLLADVNARSTATLLLCKARGVLVSEYAGELAKAQSCKSC